MATSYQQFVAPELTKLNGGKPKLDVVYISHIDDDHIGGVLAMMNDLMDWRVFDFQEKNKKAGDKAPKKPRNRRPPEIAKIWHNAFHELLKDNAGEIGDMLAASTAILSASNRPLNQKLFTHFSNLALSKAQALQLARRAGPDQLDIPVNPEFDHKLMVLKGGPLPKLKVGTMEFVMIGPFECDLDNLRKEWNQWLRKNKEQVAEIRRKAKADEDRLKSDVDRLLAPLTSQSDAFAEFQVALAKALGNRTKVTTPNLASLMFLAREGNQTVLLTGDGHADDALKGLKQRGFLDANGKIHVSVLKVQHHGSQHNMTSEFAQSITANDYVFCGNGFATNPETEVIDLIIKERKKALPNKPFTLWFNSTEALTHPEFKAHMRSVKKNVDAHVAAGGGKVKARWMSGSFLDL
jgi:hypothetical protein